MFEILIVTVKNHADLSALFLNGIMVYRTYPRVKSFFQTDPGQCSSSAVAYRLAKALGMNGKLVRSVNIPYQGNDFATMDLDGRTYTKARRYLTYRDKSTALRASRAVIPSVTDETFGIFPALSN